VPAAKSGDLLYAAGQGLGYVLTYPAGSVVASFKLAPRYKHAIANGLCSDSNGNVFVAAGGAGFTKLYEYSHGGTVPFATLHPSVVPISCSSDPTSGDLAVVSSFPTEGLESVAIYTNARGEPKVYCAIPNMTVYAFCAYDYAGDLFVDGESKNSHFALSELSKGSSTFTSITLKGLKTSNPGNVQWVGKYLTVAVPGAHRIYTVQISGTTGTVVGTTVLDGWKTGAARQSWIQVDRVVAPDGDGSDSRKLGIWKYPAGGMPIKILSGFVGPRHSINGVTVSLAK
jgi:hypothetical protein